MTCFLHIETPDTIFEKICQTKIFSMLLENFLATFFCCSNKKQQIFWQVKLWGFVAFCRSNKIFSPNFFSTSCGCTREKFLVRAHPNTSKFWQKKPHKPLFLGIFWPKFWSFVVRARQNFFARAPTWCWKTCFLSNKKYSLILASWPDYNKRVLKQYIWNFCCNQFSMVGEVFTVYRAQKHFEENNFFLCLFAINSDKAKF